ncbi:pilus assembly protein TadG-related protein [Agromyces albus]|uniref:pilus assembly protein TadG-related protein n=1 Tax=Agromyces albus TaxID=205332 RepID=UPI00278027FF|nr:pilus assembly protein TadG-related protein [Agromyces albus]MDQ0575846.1 putative membrane protein [Agromyces albus]
MIRRIRGALDRDDERGSTLLLTIFYCFLGLSLVMVVVSATSLYLERKRLFTLADGAALAGAEAWSLDTVRIDDDRLSLELDSAGVSEAVVEYLGDAARSLEDVSVIRAASDDGQSATVTLRGVWYAPVHTELVPVAVPIEVTATARSVFH